jgi:hypothetical protein
MSTFEHHDQELQSIDLEIARMAQLCGIQMLQPGMAEAVLRGDASVCATENSIAWDKLRGLLTLHYHVVSEKVHVDGVESAAEAVREALEKVSVRMQQGQ